MLIVACLILGISSQGGTPKLGAGLEGIGGRGLEFVDVMKTARPWETLDGRPAKVDASGWPLEDARTVAFDMRPTFAWAPPMDDPSGYQIDVSGRYSLSFKGKADLSAGEDPNSFRIENQQFNAATVETTAELVVPKGRALVIINFRNTDNGVKNVRLLRPGYARDGKSLFTKPFLAAIKQFPAMRFMDWLQSNGTNPFFGDAKNTTEWSDRHVPADAHFGVAGRKFGVPWEYIVALGNQTQKDIWINIPVAASDDYIRQLAKLMKRDLNPKLNIYLEYSNEVWNWGFLQATYNRMAAEAEVKAGKSNLNNDGETNWDVWRRRRHARRTMEIGQIFASEFGKDQLNKRLRPVMAWWVIAPDHYADMLAWLEKTYGPPRNYLHAVAAAPYFNIHGAPKDASVDVLIAHFRKSSDSSVPHRKAMIDIARKYGLKAFCYEGGSDTGGGDPANVANRIRAERDPRMKDLILHDLRDNWYALGGDLFMYFTLSSAYSRYGCWGLTDDITKLDTPKFQAAREILTGN
ncbi:MAG: hypothetical protein H7Y17_14425 [Chlorobia bacterium]|nr:hypothetical protein [Fimbriimonadaceae bacterium]